MTSLFVCPLCGGALVRQDGAYRCPAGHSFDIAREGHTYLLPVNRTHSKAPGDDKAMAAARSAFLSRDYYAPLRDALCELSVSLTGNAPAVLDAAAARDITPPPSTVPCAGPVNRPAWPVRTSPNSFSGWPPNGNMRWSWLWPPPTACRWRTEASTCC